MTDSLPTDHRDETPVRTSRSETPRFDRAVREDLARRDPAALEQFFDAWFDRLHGYVRRLVREEHLAEDLVQEIFLHIYRSLDSYDPARPLAPWLYTIATNKIRDHWRSRRHLDARWEVSAEGDEAPVLVSPDRGPTDRLEAAELSTTVRRAIEGMPEILSQTLVLRYYEGLSFAAIGAIVDRNETAVRKRYSRALNELRERLVEVARSGEMPDVDHKDGARP